MRHLNLLAGKNPLFVKLLLLCHDALPFFKAEVEQSECIRHHVFLNFVVQGRVSGERRGGVHFKQPGPEVSVNKHVEAQNLEGH